MDRNLMRIPDSQSPCGFYQGLSLVKVEIENFVPLAVSSSPDFEQAGVGVDQGPQQMPLLFDPSLVKSRHYPLVAMVETRSTSLGWTPCRGRGWPKSSDCPFHTTWGSPSPCRISPRSRRS